MANKATNAEIEERVSTVFKLLSAGASRAEILLYASQNWMVTPRQVTTYIQRATKQFQELSKVDRTYQLGMAITRLNDLYKASMRIQDYKGALQVQKEINKLYALYEPERHEVKVDSWQTEIIALLREGKLTPEQVQAELGHDLATELFESIGLRVAVTSESGTA